MISFPPEPKRISLPILPDSLDSLLDEGTQKTIEEVLTDDFPDQSKWCPHLRVEGNYWTYCALDHDKLLIPDAKVQEKDLQYNSRVDHMEIQTWCACGRQQECIFYRGDEYSKASNYTIGLTIFGEIIDDSQ